MFVPAGRLGQAPEITTDGRRVTGRRTNSRGRFWEFDIAALKPATQYKLELRSEGRALAEPWNLSTFPDPDSDIEHVRVVFYTCAGGHDVLQSFQPVAVRQALLGKALSFKPHAIVANGDQVYWDLFAPGFAERMGASAKAIAYAGRFDKSAPIFGTAERGLPAEGGGRANRSALQNIVCSTPVFFVQDDHDYFDNDTATDEIITFPPSDFMISARARHATFALSPIPP